MGRSQETTGKKEKTKQKIQKRKDKEEKKEMRKANSDKGKSLDDMMAYVDEYGNITDTPPDPKKKKVIKAEDIMLGVPSRDVEEEEAVRNGIITYFNDGKGYGFIKDLKSQESIFVHANELTNGPVKEKDKVTFEVANGKRGLSAVLVKKI
ncbi:cold shock domain-containing protein [Taibaiella lutea]|jgi:cold shock CspA family protein|uniref:Cold shock domain-containing protein n=1 Tax=Taibaiella lutea TaxID=2608001 RepID=A0A5M6CHV1_9BACT|nr:cold shock domain-containing protein [Taibaiella lutea]KAA5534637.1 cold shock domain-containing protein [Taibaiella lutea]